MEYRLIDCATITTQGSQCLIRDRVISDYYRSTASALLLPRLRKYFSSVAVYSVLSITTNFSNVIVVAATGLCQSRLAQLTWRLARAIGYVKKEHFVALSQWNSN